MWCLGTSASYVMLSLMSYNFTQPTICEPFHGGTGPLGDPFRHGFLTGKIPDFNFFPVETLEIFPLSLNSEALTRSSREYVERSRPFLAAGARSCCASSPCRCCLLATRTCGFFVSAAIIDCTEATCAGAICHGSGAWNTHAGDGGTYCGTCCAHIGTANGAGAGHDAGAGRGAGYCTA